jgi:hypothetical protein
VWTMDPGQAKIDRNRGAALWGNLVISVTSHDGRVVATDRDTGKVVWEKNLRDQPDMTLNAAPLALGDRILVGASGGDQGVRNWLVALDPKTGNELWRFHAIPGPGEPGHETWKDKKMPGRPAAEPSTSRALMIRRPTRPTGAPAIRRRNTTARTDRATISTRTARWRSTPRPASSAGITSTRPTTRWTMTRLAATS